MTIDQRIERLHIRGLLETLGSSLFSTNIVFHESLVSTNTLAMTLASSGAPEGTVVLAEAQSAGKGRTNRQWLSPAYTNLLFSVLLRSFIIVDRVFVLTLIMALAAIDGIKEISGLNPMIKWPNDLYIEHKKLAGILTEFSTKENKIEYVVIGIGLNVNWNPDEGDGPIYPTTSIFAETGIHVSRTKLLARILKSLEHYYQDVLSGSIDGFYERWNDLSLVQGKWVEIRESEKKTLLGKALRINHQGALVVMDTDGREHTVFSGDVSVKIEPMTK